MIIKGFYLTIGAILAIIALIAAFLAIVAVMYLLGQLVGGIRFIIRKIRGEDVYAEEDA